MEMDGHELGAVAACNGSARAWRYRAGRRSRSRTAHYVRRLRYWRSLERHVVVGRIELDSGTTRDVAASPDEPAARVRRHTLAFVRRLRRTWPCVQRHLAMGRRELDAIESAPVAAAAQCR